MAVAVLLLMVGQLLLAPLSASAKTTMGVPAPTGVQLLFVNQARGLQIYACKNGVWAFHAPRAELFDPESHQRTGIHYGGIDRGLNPGPWWESLNDGSRIRARPVLIFPSPDPDTIPELQLEVVESFGSGVFSKVSIIQRVNTAGGAGPTGACSGNEQRWVHYTADYYFYSTP